MIKRSSDQELQMQGLQDAGPGFVAADDPLGIGLRQRARDARELYETTHPGDFRNVLPDPRWDAWFQAVDEAGGGRPVNFSGGASPAGSRQLTGAASPFTAGTEVYGRHGRYFPEAGRGIASDSNSTFNTVGPGAAPAPNRYMPTYDQAASAAQEELKSPYKSPGILSGLTSIRYGR